MSLDFVAGCLGGFSGTLVSHPLDTIKVRLQTQDGSQPKYTGTWNCFQQIIKGESVYGLYKGLAPPLVCQIGINALIFGVHGNTLRYLQSTGIRAEIIAGAVSGGVQSLISCPMELIKIRLQMQGVGETRSQMKSHISKEVRYEYDGPIDCIKKIYKYENGIAGLSRGFRMTLIRELPSFSLYFGTYYYLCSRTGAIDNGRINIPKLLIAGASAGVISWLPTYPLDFVKTRLQMDGMGETKYSGILDCVRKSYQKEGWQVFYRGLNATVLRAIPMNAACLTTVTVFLHFVSPELFDSIFLSSFHYSYDHICPGFHI